jgi:hypothetical protein
MSNFNSGIGLKKQRPKGQFSASGPGGSKFAQFLAPSGEGRSLYRWSWRLFAWSETINGLKVDGRFNRFILLDWRKTCIPTQLQVCDWRFGRPKSCTDRKSSRIEVR